MLFSIDKMVSTRRKTRSAAKAEERQERKPPQEENVPEAIKESIEDQNVSMPEEQLETPTENEEVQPIQEETPIQEENRIENEEIPVQPQGDQIEPSVVDEDTPLVREDSPLVREDPPFVEEDSPLVEEDSPLVREDSPLVREDSPLVEEDSPLVEEDSPLVEEDSPLVEEDSPLARQDSSLTRQDSPLVERNLASVEENSPLVEKNSPLVREDLPLVREDSPLGEEDSPLVREHSPLIREDSPLEKEDLSLEQYKPENVNQFEEEIRLPVRNYDPFTQEVDQTSEEFTERPIMEETESPVQTEDSPLQIFLSEPHGTTDVIPDGLKTRQEEDEQFNKIEIDEIVEDMEDTEDPIENKVNESQNKSKKKKRRRKKKARTEQKTIPVQTEEQDSGVEIEYVSEKIDLPKWDPHYSTFEKIFETFKIEEKALIKEEEEKTKAAPLKKEIDPILNDDDDDDDDDDDMERDKGDDKPKLSKKQMKKQSRMEIAQLKQMVSRPDVVEMHDVNSKDPQLLVYLKAYKNTVPVPRHWCFKRKYLAGKRGFLKAPFELPEFIKQTGIMEMRAAMQEKEDSKTLKTKQRGKIRPKLGKIDIDYQKLHDAFFKFQTKPKMTIHGDLYYEGKEFEIRLKEKKPGDLSDDLRTALGMPVGPGKNLIPPPWLIAMQRYGPPPSYPNLNISGLNAPIPEGASFGYHAGGWGKPPVDEMGKPLYGDVFGIQMEESPQVVDEENIDKTPWGEFESESESEEESEEEEEDEDQTGLVTPGDAGLVTPSGMSSVGAGLETPDIIELRKRKEIEDAMETGGDTPALYTVLAEKRTNVGASMMGSAHTYDLAAPKKPGDGVEITLDPSELELEPAAMAAKYDDTMKEREAIQNREDLSDMVAEHAAKKKRKKPTESGKAAKKYKEFKF